MIDLYTAAICTRQHPAATKLPSDIHKGLARLTLGLVLLATVIGNLP